MTLLDQALLLATAVTAIYMLWRFWSHYRKHRGLQDVYYIMGFGVLLLSALLLMLRGRSVLASPYVLTISSLIPLGISMGIAEQYFPAWKRAYKWFALIGFLAIAITSVGQMTALKKVAVPVFHGGAGLVIIFGPFLARKAPLGFRWVGIGGLFIGIAGLALAVLSAGSQLLFFTSELVMQVLPALLLLMSLAFTSGFMKDINAQTAA